MNFSHPILPTSFSHQPPLTQILVRVGVTVLLGVNERLAVFVFDGVRLGVRDRLAVFVVDCVLLGV
jgi:hypothetical protein